MEAHALVSRLFDSEVKYPFLTLLISGGHCLLVLVENYNRFLRLGESMDISPGNCVDKVARQLGLFEISKHDCSSGGAQLEIYASKGDPQVYKTLTDSMLNFCRKNKNCHFSYGGLISAAFRLIEKETLTNSEPIKVNDTIKNLLKEDVIANISAAVQASIILQLQDRLKRALIFLEYNKIKIEHVVISGGVASNKEIRSVLEKECKQFNLKISLPPISYCTDNGVMISWNGVEKLGKV
jgi:N6-L-threonylcarbamoyladenine synthase